MPILPFEGRVPKIHPSAFVAPNATVIGDVTIGPEATIWYGVVLRGDLAAIEVGEGSNVQDNSVLHTAADAPCIVKKNITVGHMACLHGCTIEDGSLIGMMATVLNYTTIPKDSLVAAGALVTERKEFPEGHLIVGSPAKAVRPLTPEQIADCHDNTARYVTNGKRHTAMMNEWTQMAGWRW